MASHKYKSASFVNCYFNCLQREYLDIDGPRLNGRLIKDRFEKATNLFRKDLYSHFGCVNAIEFSNNGQWLVSGGDDRRVMIWDIEKSVSQSNYQPRALKSDHTSNIFCLAFDSKNRLVFSGGNDEQVLIHDFESGECLNVVNHSEAVYGLSVDAVHESLFATACNDGKVYLFDSRTNISNCEDSSLQFTSRSAFHAVMHNPVESNLIVTANTKDGINLWDSRNAKDCLLQFTNSLNQIEPAMSVRFNNRGTQILALRRRLPAILYSLTCNLPVAEFDDNCYYNSCTMKSCCFGGTNDEYILSGSDDFKLYIWKIPEDVQNQELRTQAECSFVDSAHLILSGHRSIVNQVRYNYNSAMIASSGVEKIVKLWSIFPLPNGSGALDTNTATSSNSGSNGTSSKSDCGRKIYSHEDYINLVLESGTFMSHDYSHQSVQEDPRMMAFFDSLVQRDIEGWTSESDDDDDDDLDTPTWNRFNTTIDSVKSPSLGSSSDEDEDKDQEDNLSVLTKHTVSYLSSLNKRIEARVKCSNSNLSSQTSNSQTSSSGSGSSPGSWDSPSTSKSSSSGSVPSQSITGHPATTNGHSINHVQGRLSCHNEQLLSETNKIANLISGKKREQLRKVSRSAIRTIVKKLKKVKKFCDPVDETAPQTSVQEERSSRYQEMVILTQDVNLKIDLDAKNWAEENKNRRSRYKLRRRLRYLTDQSDFILNEVVPLRASTDSDSDSSDDDNNSTDTEPESRLLSRSLVVRNLHLIESSESSDSDSEPELNSKINPISSSNPDPNSDPSPSLNPNLDPISSSDAVPSSRTRTHDEDDDEDILASSSISSNVTSSVLIPFEPPEELDHVEDKTETKKQDKIETQDKSGLEVSSSSSNNCNLQSGPFVKLGAEELKSALECLCRANPGQTICLECSKEDSSSIVSSSNPSSSGVTFRTLTSNRSNNKKRLLNSESDSEISENSSKRTKVVEKNN